MTPTNTPIHRPYPWKATLQKSFLVCSLIFLVLVVTQCKDTLDEIDPKAEPPLTEAEPPEFGLGGSEEASLATTLFVAAAKSAGGKVGGTAAGWAMSALGLSNGSPDYTAQLDKIDEDLQVVITQLSEIDQELKAISGELGAINCTEWASTLKDEKGRIDYLMNDYKTKIATVTTGGIIDSSDLSDWADQVLAQGKYTSHTPMGEILEAIAAQLYVTHTSGILPACIQTIPTPTEASFGTDTIYYNQVKQYTDYYSSYQVRGLILQNEALHYKAWVAAGSPDSDTLPSDSTSYVCANPNVVKFCNQAAASVSTLYNNLLDQLKAGGAPYTDDDLVMSYSTEWPYLWPYSLEDFTTAAGDNCADPLTSAAPCGITAGWYNTPSMKSVKYQGYGDWHIAGDGLLTNLLADWKSGTAGNYLENLGFQNMKNKIILSANTITVTLHGTFSSEDQEVVCFFDTDIDYSDLPGIVCSGAQFNRVAPYDKKGGGICDISHTYVGFDFNTPGFAPPNRNSFYNLDAWARKCGSQDTSPFSWSEVPGWAISTNSGKEVYDNAEKAKQFRWPVAPITNLPCTNNRSNKNAGEVWTKCGDDFSAWLDFHLPRPETCDNSGTGVTCSQI